MNSQPKSITIFHQEFTGSGGAEHTLLETMEYLTTQGFNVNCYATIVSRANCFPDIINKYPIHSLIPYTQKMPRELLIIIAILLFPISVLFIKKADIYYGANQGGPLLAFIASIIHHRPYLVYMPYPQGFLYPRQIDKEFGLYQDFSLIAKYLLKFLAPILRIVDKKIIQHASAVITEGEYSQSLFKKIYNREIINCPAAAQPISDIELEHIERFNGTLEIANHHIQKPYILITNRHVPKKKFEYAIDIAESLQTKKDKNIKIIITGKMTSYTKNLQQIILQKNLSNIVFTNYTTENDTTKLYKNAAVYIYTAPEEDFGKGIVQSMACAVPAVAWNNAGPTGIILDNKTGFLVKPFNVDEFTQKTFELLENQAKNIEMGINARNQVIKNFSLDQHNKTILKTILS